MRSIAVILRALQLYAHNAHNLAKGKTFFEDHEFFGGLYGVYEKWYDDVVERMIGLGESADLVDITESACKIAKATPKNNDDALSVILATEKSLCVELDSENKKASLGTQNLLQALADDSEKRQYLIAQRLK